MGSVVELISQVAVPGLGAVLTGFASALAVMYIRRIRDERLRELLLSLVRAAEQIYGGGQGDLKRAYVMSEARALGHQEVRTAEVEAAVWQMNRELG